MSSSANLLLSQVFFSDLFFYSELSFRLMTFDFFASVLLSCQFPSFYYLSSGLFFLFFYSELFLRLILVLSFCFFFCFQVFLLFFYSELLFAFRLVLCSDLEFSCSSGSSSNPISFLFSAIFLTSPYRFRVWKYSFDFWFFRLVLLQAFVSARAADFIQLKLEKQNLLFSFLSMII